MQNDVLKTENGTASFVHHNGLYDVFLMLFTVTNKKKITFSQAVLILASVWPKTMVLKQRTENLH